jgi:glycosyltransferase involved in cell wall biosynthesis
VNDLPISVIIPTYNRAQLVTQSVMSVLAAVSEGDEVIVVDDGSTDDTEAALRPYIRLIRYLRIPNGGAGAARNFGIRSASHDLIAFNDSDDVWMPNKLWLQRAVMRARPDLHYCFTDFKGKCHDGSEIPHFLQIWHKDSRSWEQILGRGVPFSQFGELPPNQGDFLVHAGNLQFAGLERQYIVAFTVLVRRSAAGESLHFPEDIAWAEDWECFGKLARNGPGAYLDCETVWNRIHPGHRLTSATSEFGRATTMIKILERLWGTDADFIAQHAERYRKALGAQHLTLAQCLIRQGKTVEARKELALAGGAPFSYRALAALPGPAARSLLSLRRGARKLLHATSEQN